MNTLTSRIKNAAATNRAGLIVFACLTLTTAALLAASAGILPPGAGHFAGSPGPVQIEGKLSQTKLVQGGRQTVYLDVSIKTPHAPPSAAAHRPTDMIIVLDRSGSMSESGKMPYAKAAVSNVLSRLDGGDRFGLISFADNAVVHSPLVAVDAGRRRRLSAEVDAVSPGGGTNMGGGLKAAAGIIAPNDPERARKVLLLSDGHANQGVTRPEELAAIASHLAETGAVLSTVGMGLNFNETLMASLADHGMGQYAYLEDLSGLDDLLGRNLDDARSIAASGSTLELQLGEGVELRDAGGYPVSGKGSETSVATGQLLAGSDKHFVMTFSVPTDTIGAISIGRMRLVYTARGEKNRTEFDDDSLKLAIVEPAHRREAVGSIDGDVYKQTWLKNNFGRMQKKLSRYLREGDKNEAEKTIADYRQAVEEAEAAADMPMASAELDDKLDAMRREVDEAFAGSRADQEVKRKRAAKSIQYGAIKEQRSNP
ncbi:MAG: vWA domain-containing protein [Gammaproteobacteria bacterium]